MSRHSSFGESHDVAGEACAWLAQLETGDMTAADREAFREWINRSSRHAVEIRRIAKMSMELNALAELASPILDAADSQTTTNRSNRFLLTTKRVAAIVASVLLIAFLVQFGLIYDSSVRTEQQLFATSVGEQREVELSDGTIVTLNTNSQLEVDYDRSERTIRMNRGEAIFEVASGRNWPFVVRAADLQVRAVGTAFAVRLLDDEFSVTVIEGQVEVAESSGPQDHLSQFGSDSEAMGQSQIREYRGTKFKPLSVGSGQILIFSSSEDSRLLVNKSARDLQRELSWQHGLHDFSDVPLEEVISEIGRYSSLSIELEDPKLREIRFGGVFRTGETKPLLDALEASYGVDVEYVGTNKVRLRLTAEKQSENQN